VVTINFSIVSLLAETVTVLMLPILSLYVRLPLVKVKVKVSICIAHRREHASNALSSLTRVACRTATVCSLQTQAGAAAG